MRIDQLTPGDIVTLGFCLQARNTMTSPRMDEETAMFVGHIGYGVDRRAEFAQLDGQGKVYNWEAYRYNGGWAFGSSANRLRLLGLVAPGPSIPEDYPVKSLKFGEEGESIAQCGTCHRWWDDAKSTSMTPTPSGRCPFEYFHADTDALLILAATA